jgi:hypothetical protein
MPCCQPYASFEFEAAELQPGPPIRRCRERACLGCRRAVGGERPACQLCHGCLFAMGLGAAAARASGRQARRVPAAITLGAPWPIVQAGERRAVAGGERAREKFDGVWRRLERSPRCARQGMAVPDGPPPQMLWRRASRWLTRVWGSAIAAAPARAPCVLCGYWAVCRAARGGGMRPQGRERGGAAGCAPAGAGLVGADGPPKRRAASPATVALLRCPRGPPEGCEARPVKALGGPFVSAVLPSGRGARAAS